MPTNRSLSIVVAAGVLVGGANLAVYAANGKPLLLGRKNVETKPAIVNNTGAGPALVLRTKPGAPPMKVTSRKKVTNLNADRVDGVDSTALANHVLTTECGFGPLVGGDQTVCPTADFTPKVPSLAIVDIGLDASFSEAPASLWAQPSVSTDSGATWDEATPNAFTGDGVTAIGQWAGVSNSGVVSLTPGTAYRFGILVQNAPAIANGDGKVTVLIVPLGPGSTVQNTNGRKPARSAYGGR